MLGIVINLAKPILEKEWEIRFLKNWLTLLVLVAFIRLQFICCCGAIHHAQFESQPCISQSASFQAEVKQNCGCSHHHTDHAEPTLAKQAESACGCQFCDHDHSHLPHLATEHLRIVPSPNVDSASLVTLQSLPIVALSSSDRDHSQTSRPSEKCLHNGISILCKFGHLRI